MTFARFPIRVYHEDMLGSLYSPYVFFLADECCEDRNLLLAMFREIRSETGVHLYDGGDGESIGEGTAAEGEHLPQLSFPSGTSGRYVWDMRDASVASTAVSDLLGGSSSHEIVLGLDCEWEPSLGGTTPNPVSTVQLSLPDGTAYCFQLQCGDRRTTKDDFPIVLKQLLEDASIKKVWVNIAVGW